MTIKDKLPSFSKISEKLTIMKFSHSNFLKIFPHCELFELFCNTRLFQKSLLIIEMAGRFKNLLPTDNFDRRFKGQIITELKNPLSGTNRMAPDIVQVCEMNHFASNFLQLNENGR